MMKSQAIPQFHLFGEAPVEAAFDFIHVETIAARSSRHGWTIAAHNHRYLHQILVIVSGAGVARFEGAEHAFCGPVVIPVPATVVHGFTFDEDVKGFVASFTDDVVRGYRDGDGRGSVRARLENLFAEPLLPLEPGETFDRIHADIRDLHEELTLARDGYQIALRAHLALLIVEIARARASRARYAEVTLSAVDPVIARLRELIEDRFRETRRIGDYAEALAMTVDRLNEHCKRITGVTVSHLVRQRLITEAKRQLMFTDLSASEIAYDLAFADPSHFSRFFRRYTDMTPQEFRAGNRS